MRNTVCEVLKSMDFSYNVSKDTPAEAVFTLGIKTENGKVDCMIMVKDEADMVLFYARSPINVPEPRRRLISDFITMANYNMRIGNFEMDFDDGEVRYKSYMLIDGILPPNEEIVKRNFMVTIRILDKYMPGIMAVAFGQASPQDAVCQIEERQNPSVN